MARRERNIVRLPVVVLVRRHAGRDATLIAASAGGGNIGLVAIVAGAASGGQSTGDERRVSGAERSQFELNI
jgi:hypothetical protein